jgi:hypothetical protein
MDFFIDALAIHRLTRLATRDEITRQIRETIEQEIGTLGEARILSPKATEKLNYVMGCDWCMSIWAAAMAYVLRKYVPSVWNTLKYVLAASTVTGLIASYE